MRRGSRGLSLGNRERPGFAVKFPTRAMESRRGVPAAVSTSRPEDPGRVPAPSPALVTALRRLLRPLVRLLLDRQITFPYLMELLKQIFVEVADGEYALEGKRQTTTRVSLLTGIHRKDVKRLREAGPQHEQTARSASLGAQLVARWMASPEYLDAQGAPRPLARQAGQGEQVSFESLVESVSKDIRPRAVLDEWLRLGVARLDDQERVTLHVAAFVPERGFDEKAFFFGRNLHDHAAAAVHNLRGRERPMPERSVYYGGLASDSVEDLQSLAEQLGMDALLAVNRRALVLQKQDRGSEGADRRIGFGIYFYRGRQEPRADEETGRDE